jgi:intein-encoded DNA endonuclease-like protein
MNFYRYVGFTIRRKQERLEEYLRRAGRLPTLPFS